MVVDVKRCFETFGEAALVVSELVVEVISELAVDSAISVVPPVDCDVPADSADVEEKTHELASV